MVTLLYIVGTIIVLVAGWYAFLSLVKSLTELARIFTKMPEPGHMKFIKLGGDVVKTADNVRGWSLNERSFYERGDRELSFSENHFGAIFMGLRPQYSIHNFEDMRWTELKEVNGVYELSPRKKSFTEPLFQFTFAVKITAMELASNIQADVTVIVTVYVLWPEKAFFDNKDWVGVAVGMVQTVVRGWVTGREFDGVKQFTSDASFNSRFAQLLREMNGIGLYELPQGLTPDYSTIDPGGLFNIAGVAVVTAYMQDLEAKGPAAQALQAKEVNRLQGEANVEAAEQAARKLRIDSEAKAAAITVVAQAEQGRARMLGEAFRNNPEISQLMAAEALANSKTLQAVGAGILAGLTPPPRP